MGLDKDIRFPEKKVDSSWKDQVGIDRSQAASSTANTHETSESFLHLVKSLLSQFLMHVGEVPHPATGQPQVDTSGAHETFRLICDLQSKTKGNLSTEEEELFTSLIPQLELKLSELSHEG